MGYDGWPDAEVSGEDRRVAVYGDPLWHGRLFVAVLRRPEGVRLWHGALLVMDPGRAPDTLYLARYWPPSTYWYDSDTLLASMLSVRGEIALLAGRTNRLPGAYEMAGWRLRSRFSGPLAPRAWRSGRLD